MLESWKEISGFGGLYDVSDLGRVRSHHGYGGVSDRTLALQTDKKTGYVFANLYQKGKLSRRSVHRLVLQEFVGPCPEGMEGCHEDGNRQNNARSNLRWDTKPNNLADRAKHGTDYVGERNPACTITAAMAREIKIRLKDAKHGVVSQVARDLGVKRSLVADIKRGRTWTSLEAV